MPPEKEKAPDGLQPSEALDEAQTLPQRVDRYGKAKDRAARMVAYLRSRGPETTSPGTTAFGIIPPGSRHDPVYALAKLEACGNWLKFRNYFTVGKVRLTGASFCREHLLCPLCAIRRGGKALQKYQERYSIIIAARPDLRPYLVTLTVRNRPDLADVYDHLHDSFARLMARRREPRKKSVLRNVSGGVGSIEVTNIGNGWHPHIHLVVLAAEMPDEIELRAEWEGITGDSFECNVKPIDDPLSGFCEVFKYAVKFSDLPPELNWQAFRVLSGRRLLTSFGCFRGVEVPEDLTDAPLDSLPYVEMLYVFSFRAHAFSLAKISEVEGPTPLGGEAASCGAAST